MEFLIAIVLMLSINTDYSFSKTSTERLEPINAIESSYSSEDFSGGTIVMDDIIAIVNTGDQSSHITGFTVYDEQSQSVVYSAGACSSYCHSYNLSQLPSKTYFATATTTYGGNVSDYITIE